MHGSGNDVVNGFTDSKNKLKYRHTRIIYLIQKGRTQKIYEWVEESCDLLAEQPFKIQIEVEQETRQAASKPAFTMVSCLAYSSTLKMEATYCSETLNDFQRSAQHYIPEDRTLHKRCCENLES
jgi:hypothetical protein